MRDLIDLKFALKTASDKRLIEEFCVHTHYLDIDFITCREGRSKEALNKILSLRDYIRSNYAEVHAVDYMPILNRLRLYGNFERIK